jgi:hypothetical protein
LQEHVFDAAMVGQAVQHRGCHFGVPENLRPVGEGEICGDQQRGVFVPPIKIALRLASRKAPAANSRTSASSITVSAKLNLARHHPPAGFYLNSSQLLSKLRAPLNQIENRGIKRRLGMALSDDRPPPANAWQSGCRAAKAGFTESLHRINIPTKSDFGAISLSNRLEELRWISGFRIES